MKKIILGFVILSLNCQFEIEDYLGAVDLSPPRLLEVKAREKGETELLFDEPLKLQEYNLSLSPQGRAEVSLQEESTLVLTPGRDLQPGYEYTASLIVEDYHGNSNRFLFPLWGWNSRIPKMLINEFTPNGSGNGPDAIEVYVLEEGNVAGVTLFLGTKRENSFAYVFPNVEVQAGDYIIIHCRREEGAAYQEITEETRKNQSKGKLSHPEAWDFWFPQDRGLSAKNGVLSLYESPAGRLIDGLVYSDREPDPGNDRLGWTSTTFNQVMDLFLERDLQGRPGWIFKNENLSPREAIRSTYTTSTRSLARRPPSQDSNTALDWHTTKTVKSDYGRTFGEENKAESYEP